MHLILYTAGFLLLASSVSYSQGNLSAEPPYGMSHLDAYGVFHSNYRNQDYEMARTFGEWMLEARPREIAGYSAFSLETQFLRMINVYSTLAETAMDPAEKRVLYGKAAAVFDLTFETFGESEIDLFRWFIRQGSFYQVRNEFVEDGLHKAFRSYENAFEIDRQRFSETDEGYFATVLMRRYVSAGERERALALIEEIEPFAGPVLTEAIDEARNELFSDPDERILFLESRLEGNDDPRMLLDELTDLYEQVGDTQKAKEMAVRLYELDPGMENVRKLADLALADAEYHEALRYLTELMEMSEDRQTGGRIALEISETYQYLDDLRSAREYARRALELDSASGEAFLRMASVYVAAVSRCTSGRSLERDDKTVYWLVLDYLEKAADANPSLQPVAAQRSETYRAVMPTAGEKHFRNWITGDPFVINESLGPCYSWIDEKTTVR